MNALDQEAQLYRYAQDLQQLMAQHGHLQQQHQAVMQLVQRGSESVDLLVDGVFEPSDFYLITNGVGEILRCHIEVLTGHGPQERALRGQNIAQQMCSGDFEKLHDLLLVLTSAHASRAIQQRVFNLQRPFGVEAYDVMVMRHLTADKLELHWRMRRAQSSEKKLAVLATDFIGSEDCTTAIVLTDSRGCITAVNAVFTQITGYSQSEVLGKSPNVLTAGYNDTDFYESFWQHLTSRGMWTGDMFNRRKNGQIFLERLSIRAICNEQCELIAYVGAFTDMTQRNGSNDQLEKLATHDSLTGLANRRLLEERLSKLLLTSHAENSGVYVLYMDLDRFKPVNDTLGHAAGDQVLQEVALRLQATVRRGDTVARVGGDEFVVVLQKMNSPEIVKGIVTSLLDTLRAPIQIGEHSISLGASVGCVSYPKDGRDIATLLLHADAAMYCAKRSELGYCFFQAADVSDAPTNSKEV